MYIEEGEDDAADPNYLPPPAAPVPNIPVSATAKPKPGRTLMLDNAFANRLDRHLMMFWMREMVPVNILCIFLILSICLFLYVCLC